MEAFDAIKKRRSIREFDSRPLEKEALEKIVDAARFAPSARAVQPWEFIVVTDGVMLKTLGNITDHGKFIADSKACVVVFCRETKYYLEDGSAATQNLMLAATALGVGSCWVAGDKKPYAPEIAKALNVPEGYTLISLVALGYPLSRKFFRAANKRDLSEVLHWEKF